MQLLAALLSLMLILMLI